jgi:PAS domain S-box-containing protein
MPAEHFLATADLLPEPMLLVTPQGVIKAANRAFGTRLGVARETLEGTQLQSLAADPGEQLENYLRICARNSHMIPGSLTMRQGQKLVAYRSDGARYRPLPEASAVCILLRLREKNEAGGVFVTLTDKINQLNAQMAGRERVEDLLRRQTETLQVTLASIGDAVMVTDADGRITFLNSTAEQITGWSSADARGRALSEVFRIVNELTGNPVEDPVAKVLQSGAIIGLANHTVLISRDERRIPIDDSAAPIRMPSGELVGVVLIFRDISERRTAEHTRAWLAAVVQSSDDAIVSKTLDGIITSWNRGAEQLFGYGENEIIGKPITTIIPAELHAEEHDILARLRRGERLDHFDTVRLTKGGRRLDVSLTVSPIRDEHGTVIGASKTARDIRERKRAEEQLRSADRQKDEFLATLAHELRNPLAPIRNATALICRTELSPTARTACEIIERQVRLMSHLVDDLLDVSRITAGRVRLQLEALELDAAVALAIESCKPALEASQHELQVEKVSEDVWVRGDRVRLPQVFSNILSNAVRYTPPGGRIRVRIERENGHGVVSITDTGVGIPAAMLQRIFDLFVQVDRSYESTGGGLGIGLSLSKRLISMHGGSIEAHSTGAGQGSEFIVRLPSIDVPREGQALRTPAEPAPKNVHQRVLIADDNQDAAQSLAMLIQLLGHETRAVHDGEAALQAAEEWHPTLVILDIGMPRLNGYLTVQRMLSRPWASATRFVALTGWGQEGDRQKASEAGFHRHLIKPVDPEILAELLASPDRSAAGSASYGF